MMYLGTYEEKLLSGAKLRVSVDSWNIQHTYKYSDKRYKERHFEISGENVDNFVEALQANYNKYAELKATVPSNTTMSIKANEHMTIEVGNIVEEINGIHIDAGTIRIHTQEEADRLISECKEAKIKAEVLQKAMRESECTEVV